MVVNERGKDEAIEQDTSHSKGFFSFQHINFKIDLTFASTLANYDTNGSLCEGSLIELQ